MSLTHGIPTLEQILQQSLIPDSGVGELAAFEPRLGEQIYANPFTETGLNRLPPEAHAAFALLGATIEGGGDGRPAIDPHALAVRLVAQGSPVLIRNSALPESELAARLDRGGEIDPLGYSFLEHVCYDALRPDLDPLRRAAAPPFGRRSFAQSIWARDPGTGQMINFTRMFSRLAEGAEWTVADIVDYGLKTQRTVGTASLDGGAIIIEPWGADALGWLYPAQRVLHRLENIAVSLERMQSGVNAKTLIFGFIGNTDQASSELRRPDRDMALLPGDATVSRVGSTAQIDQLISEFKLRLERYMALVHLVHIEDKSHVPNQRSLWQMAPMVAYCGRLQDQLTRVLAAAGIRAQFARLQAESVADRRAMFELLREMSLSGAIDSAQLRERSLTLVS